LRYNNDLERIDYLKKLNAEGKFRKILNTLSILKRRTRKIKNSRLKNSLVISIIILIAVTPAIGNEFSVIVLTVFTTNLAGNSVIPISAIIITHNNISVPIRQKRGRGRSRKNKKYDF
jgi:hypothetical protein